MFNPSKDEVRQFFCQAWKKHLEHEILTPLESIAARWMIEHPEYHSLLEDLELAQSTDFSPEQGQTNPFLHLAMHLSISAQIQIDQPTGIRAIAHELAARMDSEHQAQHQIMECLGQVLWQAQRQGTPPDLVAYQEALRRLL